jgi:mannose/fructose/N-acetylgalactosamine-specific phosphotransferase system component IID
MALLLPAGIVQLRTHAGRWLALFHPPGLEKIHADDKEDLALSMTHNMEFFNIHPFLVTFAMGIILSMEQKKVDIPTIRAVRVSLMGPLGGIGDALFWMTLVPITGRHLLEHGHRWQHVRPDPVPHHLQHRSSSHCASAS